MEAHDWGKWPFIIGQSYVSTNNRRGLFLRKMPRAGDYSKCQHLHHPSLLILITSEVRILRISGRF